MTRISGYTTCLQALQLQSPLTERIEAMSAFCDEVVVVDGGSSDGTWELLQQLAESRAWLQLHRTELDRSDPRWGVTAEIELRAEARSRCSGEFCWLSATDEIVASDAAERIRLLVEHWPDDAVAIDVPIIEYWGSLDFVRADARFGHPRLSRNDSHVNHGIPRELRRFDSRGELYLAPFHPAADQLIDVRTHERVRTSTLVDPRVEAHRRAASREGFAARLARCELQVAFNRLIDEVPSVFHVGSIDLLRKVENYRTFGAEQDTSLYDCSVLVQRSPFGKPWTDVTTEDVARHSITMLRDGPRQGESVGPLIRCGKLPPVLIETWLVARLEASPADVTTEPEIAAMAEAAS